MMPTNKEYQLSAFGKVILLVKGIGQQVKEEHPDWQPFQVSKRVNEIVDAILAQHGVNLNRLPGGYQAYRNEIKWISEYQF
jgi:hypothetical protein